ncbi:hypothetical protein HYO99_gp09 [Roseobacter phage RD-1410W1-01]|uniref:Uncharacterized protein n=1 Tax=Roseobacter phage RD-1410W1-01 TaxID=1815984 RepID=A0A191VYF6_9CAUD|nr:hypothetical protein HYO99_gp09 [Roseobacter phage RD-1410W1-01]ANJ20743.1 hypothetical protein RDp01_gp09 [Roseobacter phage RD-1410W1-01]
MRAMYQAASDAVVSVFDTVTSTATAAEKVLGDANHYVTENSKANRLTITNNAKMRATKSLAAHRKELNEDEELSQLFDEISAEW